jgi:hypothetical protein
LIRRSSRDLLGLESAGDLVVVGDRDRAQALLLGGLEKKLRRGRAVRRVIGVHVQVAVDELAPLQPAANLRVPGAVTPPPNQPAVDRLDVVGHDVPAPRLEAGPG